MGPFGPDFGPVSVGARLDLGLLDLIVGLSLEIGRPIWDSLALLWGPKVPRSDLEPFGPDLGSFGSVCEGLRSYLGPFGPDLRVGMPTFVPLGPVSGGCKAQFRGVQGPIWSHLAR